MNLLTREEFRAAVFARDRQLCVWCGEPGQDAHHIMERRLWSDGGYYLNNGATLCGGCHLRAEATEIMPQQLWDRLGVKPLLPEHLYEDQAYDKWGNVVLPTGRLRGELFDDPSVQKVLAPVLHLFTYRVKYPRTFHVPWSPGATQDDKYMPSTTGLEGAVVVTRKMDGEQTTIYPDGTCHARSIDSGRHPSRTWVKNLAGDIGRELPVGWRLCGENLWAKHSILYERLPSYFLVFSLWDGLTCLSWEETEEWAGLLSIATVPVLYKGPYDEKLIKALPMDPTVDEGYVVRRAGSFHYREFKQAVGKYVRKGHVHTHGHWMRERLVQNQLERP